MIKKNETGLYVKIHIQVGKNVGLDHLWKKIRCTHTYIYV